MVSTGSIFVVRTDFAHQSLESPSDPRKRGHDPNLNFGESDPHGFTPKPIATVTGKSDRNLAIQP